MIRLLALAALSCCLSIAQAEPAPPLPTNLADLKKLAGIEEVTTDLKARYGNYPVTAVLRRDTKDVEISYLVHQESVFGYLFRFRSGGEQTDLWHKTLNSFLASTFPEATFTISNVSAGYAGPIFERVDLATNNAAYQTASKAFLEDEAARLRATSFGEVGQKEEASKPAAATSVSISDYRKKFPDLVKLEVNPKDFNFEYPIQNLPVEGVYSRKAGGIEFLVLTRGEQIFGYIAKLPMVDIELQTRSADAGLAAAYPDATYSREMIGGLSAKPEDSYNLYKILDRKAYQAALDAHISQEAAKLKALLNP